MRLKGLETCDHVLCLKHVPSHEFLLLLATANCFIGNSSAGIREAGAFGTPVINIGNRQVLMQCPVRLHLLPCLVHGSVHDSRSLRCRKLLKWRLLLCLLLSLSLSFCLHSHSHSLTITCTSCYDTVPSAQRWCRCIMSRTVHFESILWPDLNLYLLMVSAYTVPRYVA